MGAPLADSAGRCIARALRAQCSYAAPRAAVRRASAARIASAMRLQCERNDPLAWPSRRAYRQPAAALRVQCACNDRSMRVQCNALAMTSQ